MYALKMRDTVLSSYMSDSPSILKLSRIVIPEAKDNLPSLSKMSYERFPVSALSCIDLKAISLAGDTDLVKMPLSSQIAGKASSSLFADIVPLNHF